MHSINLLPKKVRSACSVFVPRKITQLRWDWDLHDLYTALHRRFVLRCRHQLRITKGGYFTTRHKAIMEPG